MKLTRRKVLGGLALAGASAAGGAGTYAFLSDEESLSINLETGELDLILSEDTVAFEGDPGEILTATVDVSNGGTLAAGSICLTDMDLSGDTGIADDAVLFQASWAGESFLPAIESGTGSSPTTLLELSNYLENNEICIDDTVAPGDEESLAIAVAIDYENVEGSGPFALASEFTVVGRQLQPS